MKSEKYSLENWNFIRWFKGNWSTVKELIKVLIPLGVAWSQTNNPVFVGLITLGGKFLLDLGHYYFKKQN